MFSLDEIVSFRSANDNRHWRCSFFQIRHRTAIEALGDLINRRPCMSASSAAIRIGRPANPAMVANAGRRAMNCRPNEVAVRLGTWRITAELCRHFGVLAVESDKEAFPWKRGH